MRAKRILSILAMVLLLVTNLSLFAYGQSGEGSQATGTFPSLAITTDQLTVTGKGTPAQLATPPPESFVPFTIATDQLTVTGKGTPTQPATLPPESFKPITITTGQLSASGKTTAVTPPTPTNLVPPAPKPLHAPPRRR